MIVACREDAAVGLKSVRLVKSPPLMRLRRLGPGAAKVRVRFDVVDKSIAKRLPSTRWFRENVWSSFLKPIND